MQQEWKHFSIRLLDPGNPAIYMRIAVARPASGNIESAAVELIGVHLLSDSTLDQAEIRDLCERMDRRSCAVKQGLIPALDLGGPIVRGNICASLAGTLPGTTAQGRSQADDGPGA